MTEVRRKAAGARDAREDTERRQAREMEAQARDAREGTERGQARGIEADERQRPRTAGSGTFQRPRTAGSDTFQRSHTAELSEAQARASLVKARERAAEVRRAREARVGDHEAANGRAAAAIAQAGGSQRAREARVGDREAANKRAAAAIAHAREEAARRENKARQGAGVQTPREVEGVGAVLRTRFEKRTPL